MPSALNIEDTADLIREPETYSPFLSVFVCLAIYSCVRRDEGAPSLVCPLKKLAPVFRFVSSSALACLPRLTDTCS